MLQIVMSILNSGPNGNHVAACDVLNVLIAYDHIVAAQRAMRLFSRLGREQTKDFLCQPQPWRFDLLADPAWRRCATSDALRADLIVITTSEQAALPVTVQTWLMACLSRKEGAGTAVVALLGTEGAMNHPGSSGLRFLRSLAREAGLDFFAPQPKGMEPPASINPQTEQELGGARAMVGNARRLAHRKVTEVRPPVMPRLNDRGVSYRHWGINE